VRVYVCRGKHCRKRNEALLDFLDDEAWAQVALVKCQGVCEGPVVGAEVDRVVEWFERVDGPKSRQGLAKLALTGELKKALRKRRVRARRGKLEGRPEPLDRDG